MSIRIPPPIIGLISALLIWWLARVIPGPIFKTQLTVLIACMIAGTGALIDIKSLLAFRRHKTTFNPVQLDRSKALVTDGLYRISRNPMYLGLLLILTGWSVYLGHPIALVILFGFVFYMTKFQIKPEEQAMIKLFGKEYATYMSRVRRWI